MSDELTTRLAQMTERLEANKRDIDWITWQVEQATPLPRGELERLRAALAALEAELRALQIRSREAHMFAADVASNGRDPEKMAVIGDVLRAISPLADRLAQIVKAHQE